MGKLGDHFITKRTPRHVDNRPVRQTYMRPIPSMITQMFQHGLPPTWGDEYKLKAL